MPITHKKVSAIPDGADTTVVRPSDWNDTHEITHDEATLDGDGVAVVLTAFALTATGIFLSRHVGNSNMSIYVSDVDPGVSFTITSTGGADDAGLIIGWMIP